jgi:hypothetical protein
MDLRGLLWFPSSLSNIIMSQPENEKEEPEENQEEDEEVCILACGCCGMKTPSRA